MRVTVNKSQLCGVACAPPSKSMAHRYLICAALSKAPCVIYNIAMSKDIEATINCLLALGVKINVTKTEADVNGCDIFSKTETLLCNESGSTLRFMIPLCLTANKKITLSGTERLFSRSLDIYKELCDERGFLFEQTKDSVTLMGNLTSGKYVVRGDVSSQFISGLLFVLPLLEGDSTIEITGKLESAPYIDMTIAAQRDFGVDIERKDNIIYIKGNQSYNPINATVEGDCSNAAFFEALRVIGHDVRVTGIDKNTLQGDYIFYDYFKKLCDGTPTLDVGNCPDLAPILMAVAAAKNGCTLINTARLKIKESDRGAAMAEELEKFGIKTELYDNKIVVSGKIHAPTEELYGHNDHRIVMSCAVLCTLFGGTIEGSEAVSKSFPDFFERISGLFAEVNYETK